MMRDLENRKKYYCKIYSQAFSPCGKYLACGDSYGQITIFDLNSSLSPSTALQNVKRPLFRLSAPVANKAVFALKSNDDFLFCGDSAGNLFGFSWSDVEEKGQDAKASFCDCVTTSTAAPAEVNALLATDDGSQVIVGGAGDNAIGLWQVEGTKLTRSFSGHTDYVHALCWHSENQIFSASEDGTVRFWDLRTGQCVHIFKPHETKCARPSLGSWIGCVAAERDWMVCGGGASLGIWHLGSRSLAQTLNVNQTDTVEHHAVALHDQLILTGGTKPRLYEWNFSGELVAEIAVSALSLYDVTCSNAKSNRVTACCGASSNVDILISPQYKAFSMDVFA